MQKESILFILKSNEIKDEDIKVFSQKLKDKNFTIDDCDKLLVKMGYEKIFTVDEDGGFEDEDDYDDFEPISKKVIAQD